MSFFKLKGHTWKKNNVTPNTELCWAIIMPQKKNHLSPTPSFPPRHKTNIIFLILLVKKVQATFEITTDDLSNKHDLQFLNELPVAEQPVRAASVGRDRGGGGGGGGPGAYKLSLGKLLMFTKSKGVC